MKKNIKLLLVAVITVCFILPFTGCPTQNSNLSYPSYSTPLSVPSDIVSAIEDNSDSNSGNTVSYNGVSGFTKYKSSTSGWTIYYKTTDNEYTTYTIDIISLAANTNETWVVAGANIGSTTSNISSNWNVTTDSVTDTGLESTVDDSGSISLTFYGTDPNYGDSSADFKLQELDASWDTGARLNYSGENTSVKNSASTSQYYDVVIAVDAGEIE